MDIGRSTSTYRQKQLQRLSNYKNPRENNNPLIIRELISLRKDPMLHNITNTTTSSSAHQYHHSSSFLVLGSSSSVSDTIDHLVL